MKEKALAIVEQLINDHKINGEEAIVLITAINEQKEPTRIINVPTPPARIINVPGTGNIPNPIPMGDPILDPFRYGVTISTYPNTKIKI